MRTFKSKEVPCMDPRCRYFKKGKVGKGFSVPVEREVDTAIAIRPIQAKFDHPTMKNLILVAGGGDFVDMVTTLRDTFNINVFICAWSESLDYKISQLATTIYLDELFDKITIPGGGQLTNADRLRQEQMFANYKNKAALIEAATHKYPDAHDYENCLTFAVQLIS